MSRKVIVITGTSPAAASTVILGSAVAAGLQEGDWFTIDAALVGATGGALDVYLQRQIATTDEVAGGVWADWVHFTQLAAAAGAVKYTISGGPGAVSADSTVATVGYGTDASAGTPALAAGKFTGGHPGSAVRCVCVAGASTSAGAAVTIYITVHRLH